MRPCVCVLVALAAASCASKNDGPAYTIKFKGDPAPGKGLTIKSTDSMEMTARVEGPDGKSHVAKQEHEQDESVYTATTLAAEGDRATKYKRAYERAVRVRDGVLEPRAYDGRTVVYTRTDGKWHLASEGDPALSQHDLANLVKNANKHHLKDRDFEPTGPVKIGEVWKLDLTKVGPGFGPSLGDLDLEKSHGEGKLVKVYDRDGARFGEFEYTVHLAVKKMEELTFEPPMAFDITATLDAAIDASTTAGKLTMRATMKGTAAGGPPAKRIRLEIDATIKGEEDHSAEK